MLLGYSILLVGGCAYWVYSHRQVLFGQQVHLGGRRVLALEAALLLAAWVALGALALWR